MTPWLSHKVQNLYPADPQTNFAWNEQEATCNAGYAGCRVVNWIVFLKQALHFLELSATPKKDNDLAQKYKASYIPIDLKSSFYEEKAPTENSRSVQSTHPSRDATQRFTDLESRLQQTAPAWASEM